MPAFKMTWKQLEELPGDEALIPILQKRGCNVHWDSVKKKIVPDLRWIDDGTTRIFYWDQKCPTSYADIPQYKQNDDIEQIVNQNMYNFTSSAIITASTCYIPSTPWPYLYAGNAAPYPNNSTPLPAEWGAPKKEEFVPKKKEIEFDDSLITSKRSVTLNKDE